MRTPAVPNARAPGPTVWAYNLGLQSPAVLEAPGGVFAAFGARRRWAFVGGMATTGPPDLGAGRDRAGRREKGGSAPGQHLTMAKINCVTNYLGDCKAQMAEVARQPEVGSLLYGVPISLKECFQCKDLDSTLGLCQNIGFPATEDSVVVQMLKKQGAIPFVHTDLRLQQPYIFPGNPLNSSKSPGGSSGGKGALIVGGRSILGFSSNIRGSIRFPAAFCCIKPTSGRISKRGMKNCVSGQLAGGNSFVQQAGPLSEPRGIKLLHHAQPDQRLCSWGGLGGHMNSQVMWSLLSPVIPSVGPMAKDVTSLALCLRALLSEDMFLLDPMVPLVPFREAVYASTKHLWIGYHECDGPLHAWPLHELVPFTPSNINYAVEMLMGGGLFSHGGKTFMENFYIRLQVTPPPPPPPQKNKRKPEGLEGLLLSAGVCNQRGLYIYLDFPAGVVPVSTVTSEDEKELHKYQGCFEDSWDLRLQKDPKNSVGIPVGVQCVALPWQEELCLRLMHEVERMTQEARKKM
ncbi:fatty-acid amide hydrolase 1-like [Petaurus breviceps papuanus]|uniref:fatty-acid amide hydrolase 1-like n=1 Tax=Petaurus breviceps papuanus TaxID=3040969 RepID=UPI0036D811F3